MGTSADYSAPPNWGGMKGDVTRSGGQALSPAKCGDFVREYVSTNGGSSSMSSGGGQLGSGSTARSAARGIGGFIGAVARNGLDAALRSGGLENLVGKSVTEILLGIVSLCGGTDGDIDSVDARNALSETMDELCDSATTADELEALLESQMTDEALGDLMITYFGNYLYQQFCRVFFSQLEKKHGLDQANSFLGSIRDFIKSSLANETVDMKLSGVDWFGAEGNRVSKAIMQNTLAVFE